MLPFLFIGIYSGIDKRWQRSKNLSLNPSKDFRSMRETYVLPERMRRRLLRISEQQASRIGDMVQTDDGLKEKYKVLASCVSWSKLS